MSSSAAAWSSKSKETQNRLRRARPRARLIRPAVGRVDDELRPFGLVEHPLDHQALTGGKRAEGQEAGPQVGDDLVGHLLGHAGPGAHRGPGPGTVAGGQQRLELGPQVADLGAQFGGAGRGLPQPEGDGRGEVGGVAHPDGARLHLDHPPRVGPQEEDVAGGRLDGEVLVDRTHGDALGVEDHPVVARLGDGTSTGESGQPGAPPRPEPAVDGVVVEVGAPPAPPGLDAPGGQFHHLVERLAGQVGERRGPAHEGEEVVDPPLPRGGHLGHDLLGQYVERRDRGVEHVEVPGTHPGQECGALDQLVAGQRVQATRRRALDVVVGPAHPLEERGDGPGRADLADQLDRPDVDAELEGGGGHQGPQVAGP